MEFGVGLLLWATGSSLASSRWSGALFLGHSAIFILFSEKGRLAAQEDEESVSSIDSEVPYDPHKSPPLPPTERARSRGSASIASADDLGSLKRLLGLDN